MIEVSRLFYYPIKSCRGIEVQEFEFSASGPLHDRQWMIVDEAGQFLTQRQLPRMQLIETRMSGDCVEFKIPFIKQFIRPETTTERLTVKIWGSPVNGILCDSVANKALSDFLGREVRLVKSPAEKRQLNPKYGQGVINFADSQPVLIISEESLAELSRRMGHAMEMERFRPNIVLRGVGLAHAEDAWEQYSIGALQFKKTKLCSRCVIINLDPVTAVSDPTVLKTLASYRRLEGTGIAFGTQALPSGNAVLRVGEKVSVR